MNVIHRSALLALVATVLWGASRAVPQAAQATTFPAAEWSSARTPGDVGWTARREALTATLSRGDTTAMIVIVGGRVLYEFGNIAEVSYIASVRKSVIAMLYGTYVDNGTIPLTASLRSLGIDDSGGLLPGELDATVADLLSSRSGVYHPAANLGDASALAPARGAVEHGRYFLYNNWDFNALEAILERQTGRSVYEIFSTLIAAPMGLQDWDDAPNAYARFVRNDTGASRFPAHHLLLSTRDMARVGYVMLRNGRWGDRQVIPAAWVRRITSVVTPAAEVAATSPFIQGLGYGHLWWIFDGPPFRNTPLEGGYTASGAFGQYITVVPGLDCVIAHKTVAPSTRNVTNETYFGTILPRTIGVVQGAMR